jgi:hypothetical protein
MFTFVDMETQVIRIRIDDYHKLKERGLKERRKLVDVISMLLEQDKETKETPRPNPSIKKKEAHPSFNQFKEIYTNHWSLNNGFEYKWNGVIDSTATNRLIRNIESRNEKGASLEEFFTVIMQNLPDFYKDKTINAINKNLNSIISEIKNGNKKDSKGWDNLPPELDWRK